MCDENKIINFEKEVYTKYLSLVESTCYKSLKNKSQLKDAVQSTFLLYIQKQDKIDSPLCSWFYWSSINISLLINRKFAKEIEYEQEVDFNPKKTEADSNIEFNGLFENLPKKKKDLLLMRYYDQLSYKEIGEKTKCSEYTARKRVDAVINYLKQRFSKKDVLISTFIGEIFLNKELAVSEVVSKNFIIQNTIYQQSIVKGVLKMYLIKKISIVALLILSFSISTSYYLSTQVIAKEEVNIKEAPEQVKNETLNKPKIIWSVMVGRNSFSATTPLIHGEFLLFPGMNELFCLDKSNGKMNWKVAGDFYHSTPTIWKEKVVAVAENGLQLINLKTGKIENVIDLSTPEYHKILADSNPTVEKDYCYLGTRTNQLVKIDLNTKEVLWKSLPNSNNLWTPALIDEKAAISAWTKSLCVFDTSNGKILWEKSFPGIGSYSPITHNNLVISGGDNGLIQAFKVSDGSLEWSKEIKDEGDQSCLGLLKTEKAMIVGTKSQVLSMDPSNGNINWKYSVKRFGYQNYSTDINGILYLGSDQSKFMMINLADGKELQVIDLMEYVDNKYKNLQQSFSNNVKTEDCGICSTPAIEINYVYVQTTAGLALCIQLPQHYFKK